jgi:hypothetical protein
MPQSDQGVAAPVKDIPLPRADGASIRIRVFPSDPRFAEDVRRVAGELASPDGLGPSDDDETARRLLESMLRGWYPRATVHERTEFGAPSHSERLWYVLRDGGVRPLNPRRERLHAALATARDLTAESEAVIDESRDLAASRVGVAVLHQSRAHPDAESDD